MSAVTKRSEARCPVGAILRCIPTVLTSRARQRSGTIANRTEVGARLLLLLSLAVVVGGAGIAYIWSILNAAVEGTADPLRLTAAVVVGLLVIAVLVRVYLALDRIALRGE